MLSKMFNSVEEKTLPDERQNQNQNQAVCLGIHCLNLMEIKRRLGRSAKCMEKSEPGVRVHAYNPSTWRQDDQEFKVIFRCILNLGSAGAI